MSRDWSSETAEEKRRRKEYGGLPWRSATAHWVYVLGFDNGTVKIGTTGNRDQRPSQIARDRKGWKVQTDESWISDCLEDGHRGEQLALAAVKAVAGSPVKGRETFEGSFDLLLPIVEDALSVVPRLDPLRLAEHRRQMEDRLARSSYAGMWKGSMKRLPDSESEYFQERIRDSIFYLEGENLACSVCGSYVADQDQHEQWHGTV